MAAVSGRSRIVIAQPNLRGYRGLTLDAFGALLQGGPPHLPTVVRRVVEAKGPARLRAAEETWRRTLSRLCEEDPFIAFLEVHRRAFQEMFTQFGISGDVDPFVEEAFDEYRGVKAYPEVPDVLHELEGEVAMAVVSNMDTKLLLEALHNNGLAFTFVITSEEEQRYKPSASLFQRAVRYLGLPAAHILHVGDSYADDVVGASSVGMGCALMQRLGGPQNPPAGAQPVVRDLREVRDLIRRSRDGAGPTGPA